MWKIEKKFCQGCGICALQCNGIQIINGYAEIVEQDSLCIERAARVCPRHLIQRI
ncbi:MAG: hypothetical protein ACTSWC_14005 [Promethearchaeota archaeon]